MLAVGQCPSLLVMTPQKIAVRLHNIAWYQSNRRRYAFLWPHFVNQALKRKKGNNLATVELSEVLSQEQLRGVMMVDTENLLTLAVAMSKAQEKDWLQGYESIGGVSVCVCVIIL